MGEKTTEARSAPTSDDFIAAAAAAAPRWGLEPTSIRILSESENVVCSVELAGGERVVLRLHRPGYNTVEELRSEVGWVAALGSAGIPVPQPRPTLDGDHYAVVDVGDQRRQVGVIDWVEGQPVGGVKEAGTGDVIGHYRRIGKLAAALRSHNDVWSPPADFVRRRWDAEGLVGADPLWGRFWEVGRLSPARRGLFAEARRVLHERLSWLSTGPDRFGLIHADLHLGNVMANGEALTIIDFDDSGFGWFAHELAVALHPVLGDDCFDDARTAIVGGYREVAALDAEEAELIDTFLTVRSLMIIGWLDDRPELPVQQFFETFATEAESVAARFLDAGRL